MPVTPSHPQLKLVTIGGGTGLSTLLRGLKPWLARRSVESLECVPTTFGDEPPAAVLLTAVVTVTDDGKSSGRLRGEFGILPPGDVRNCLAALADDDSLLTKLFCYRFPGDGALGGHSLGNLMLTALTQMRGDFLEAVDAARALLGIEARVLPSTLDQVDLVAECGGEEVRGQVAIKSRLAPIRGLRLTAPNARALPEAVGAIMDADLVTLGPGSLFTSVIPNLLVGGIADALSRTRAKKVYICNVMTEADETHGLTAADHLAHLLAYSPALRLDYALFNSSPISAAMRDRYATENATALTPPTAEDQEASPTRFVARPLAAEDRFVRHDPARLCRAVIEIYNGV
jgi:uncharacterized cofD-like protein